MYRTVRASTRVEAARVCVSFVCRVVRRSLWSSSNRRSKKTFFFLRVARRRYRRVYISGMQFLSRTQEKRASVTSLRLSSAHLNAHARDSTSPPMPHPAAKKKARETMSARKTKNVSEKKTRNRRTRVRVDTFVFPEGAFAKQENARDAGSAGLPREPRDADVAVPLPRFSPRTDRALHGFAAGHVPAALLELPAALAYHALPGAQTGSGLPPVVAAAVLAPPRALAPLLRAPPRAAVVALGVVAGRHAAHVLHVAHVLHGGVVGGLRVVRGDGLPLPPPPLERLSGTRGAEGDDEGEAQREARAAGRGATRTRATGRGGGGGVGVGHDAKRSVSDGSRNARGVVRVSGE